MLLEVKNQNQIMIYIQESFSKPMQTVVPWSVGEILSEEWLLRSHMWDTALNITLV